MIRQSTIDKLHENAAVCYGQMHLKTSVLLLLHIKTCLLRTVLACW